MAISKRVIGLLVVLGCVSGLVPSAGAWSNGGYSADPTNPDYGTHDWIVEKALELQTKDVAFLKTTYHTELLLGTEAPDNPEYIGDTSNHHVYYTSAHVLEDDVCADRAAQIYQMAVAYIEAGDYGNTAFDIGVMAHYVADVGVFGHTMGASTDWGAEVHHSDYENEFESRIDFLPLPGGIALGDSDAYDATVSLAENITFGNNTIKSNVWMDTNYNWADPTFLTSAMDSLNRSVAAVASVINHFMIQTGSSAVPAPPQPPTGLSAVVEDSQVTLNWTAPSDDGGADITSYIVYRGPSVTSRVAVMSLPGSVFNWTDDTVSRGKSYYYWVVAGSTAGSSELSDGILVKVPAKKISMIVPIIVSAASIIAASGGAFMWRRSRQKTGR
jgi:hypothetical protein